MFRVEQRGGRDLPIDESSERLIIDDTEAGGCSWERSVPVEFRQQWDVVLLRVLSDRVCCVFPLCKGIQRSRIAGRISERNIERLVSESVQNVPEVRVSEAERREPRVGGSDPSGLAAKVT
jgi:hypothetical protein